MSSDKKFKYAYDIDLNDDSTASKLLKLVGTNKQVLELGCGPGHMSKVMKEQLACSVTGIEIDAEAAKEAQKFCDEVKVCDLDREDLTRLFPSRHFDVVLMADVLEHLKEPQRTLEQAARLIAPKGFLVISIPNVAHEGIIATVMQGQFPYSDLGLLDKTHLRFFTGQSFRQLLSRCGLCIEKWMTQEVPVNFTEFSKPFEALPEPIRAFLDKCPDARTYQFIIRAKPKGQNEVDDISRQLDAMVEQQLKERDIWFEKHYLAKENSSIQHIEKEDDKGFVGKLIHLAKRLISS